MFTFLFLLVFGMQFAFAQTTNAVKYHLPGSEQKSVLDKEDVEPLFVQICKFSQLYWKSVSAQPLPVTLRYPEMLAQIVPHFSHPELPQAGKETLWFL